MKASSSAAIRSAFLADALNLGPHWVYNQSAIARLFPDGVYNVHDPISQYHPGKSAGDLTHYGDQMMCQLNAFAAAGHWDQEVYQQKWQAMWRDSESYMDGATKETLARLEDPSSPASMSSDMAGASRALLVAAMIDEASLDEQISAARTLTQFTHGDPEVVDAAELLVRMNYLLVSGTNLPDAVQEACQHPYPELNAKQYFEMASSRLEADPLQAAEDLGLTCHTSEALPVLLFFLLRYPDDIASALSTNALAGGDNSARAIPLAMLLTQANGWGSYQEKVYAEVNQRRHIDDILVQCESEN
ncbi:ADP-ribosylglycohydrolase family protein [Verrucomicrobiaceae bacterium R5-34]|nr:ADP-ribosylglycohydrolase family protein [Verrucomicrobiaceae bacterium R5-34]